MKIKADWKTYLRDLRLRELDRIFHACPRGCFDRVLELGAGDGVQSRGLAAYAAEVLAIDQNPRRLPKGEQGGVRFQIGDVEEIDRVCPEGGFDLIFSSNLLEHIPDRERLLRKLRRLLKDHGVMIHVVPNTFLKGSWLGLFHLNLAVELLEVLTRPGGWRKVYRKVVKKAVKEGLHTVEEDRDTNNPKGPPRTFVQRYLWPAPHGAYASHGEEWRAYRDSRWRRLFEESGLEVFRVLKMPVVSGYGFGWNRARRLLEKAGFSSSYAYILFKTGQDSPYRRYWEQEAT